MRKTALATILIFALGTFALSQADKKMGSKSAPAKSTEQALKDIETKWAAAGLKSDADAVGSIVADDWSGTNAMGKVQTKAEMLDEIYRGRHECEVAGGGFGSGDRDVDRCRRWR